MNREQYETKIYLSKVKGHKLKIESHLMRIEELEAYVNKISSFPATEKVVGGSDKVEVYNNKLAKLIDEKTKIMAKIDKLNQEIKDVEMLIDSLSDIRIKTILTYRYINCLTWEEIGKRTTITERQSINLHHRGLSMIAQLIKT